MAILYTVVKSEGVRTLTVSQDTNYIVYYSCGGKDKETKSGSIASGDSISLPIDTDGTYKVVLSAAGQPNVTYLYTVYINLLKSLIIDVETYLSCTPVSTSCNDAFNVCLDKQAEQYFQYKDLYTKLLVFQALYLEDISEELVVVFSNYLVNIVNADRCSIQTYINNMLREECIWGSAKNSSRLYTELIIYFYYGLYFTELNLAGTDEDEIAYVNDLFNVDAIDTLIETSTRITRASVQTIYNGTLTSINTRPSIDDYEIVPTNNLPENLFQYTFSGIEFSNNYSDIQGDPISSIRFALLPVRGTLKYNGAAVVVGAEYDYANAGLFTYEVTIDAAVAVFDIIQFQVNDDNPNSIYSDMAQVTINTSAYVNQPISQLGDLTLNKDNRENHVFTVSDFTTSLVPPYVDPEGDSLDAIRIDSLPATGQLQVSATPVQINDIIPAATITAGNFIFVAPDQDGGANNIFNFSARDAGSLQWVS